MVVVVVDDIYDPSFSLHPLLPAWGEVPCSLDSSLLLLLLWLWCKTMTTKKWSVRVLVVVVVVEETAAWPHHQLRFRLLRDRSILPGVGRKTQCAHAGGVVVVVVVEKTRKKK